MSTETSPGGRGKLVPLFLAVNALFLAAILAVVLLRLNEPGKAEPARPAADPAEPDPAAQVRPGPAFRLPEVTVHLRNPETDRYARVGLELELFAEADRAVVNAYLPMIRDSLLAWFSDQTVEELQGSEGLARAKAALLDRFEAIVPGRRVRALYITDFVVQ